jgi:hypothetical protein
MTDHSGHSFKNVLGELHRVQVWVKCSCGETITSVGRTQDDCIKELNAMKESHAHSPT